jgi:hypothetical protein
MMVCLPRRAMYAATWLGPVRIASEKIRQQLTHNLPQVID